MKRHGLAIALATWMTAACAGAPPAPAAPLHAAVTCAVKNDQVVITLPGSRAPQGRNPRWFGVDHAGTFYYVNYADAGAAHSPYAAAVQKLALPIDGQRATRYRDGVPQTTRLFAEGGRYGLLFADNLETEPGATYAFTCTVQIGRPASTAKR